MDGVANTGGDILGWGVLSRQLMIQRPKCFLQYNYIFFWKTGRDKLLSLKGGYASQGGSNPLCKTLMSQALTQKQTHTTKKKKQNKTWKRKCLPYSTLDFLNSNSFHKPKYLQLQNEVMKYSPQLERNVWDVQQMLHFKARTWCKLVCSERKKKTE